MKVTRRKFIGTAGIAAGAALTASVSGQSLAKGRSVVPIGIGGDALSRLTWDSFLPYVTTEFTFTDRAGNAAGLKLVDMTDTRPAGYKPKTPYEECFELVFAGASKQSLPQDTYTVEHFALGKFELFITGGRVSKGSRYVAVINRIAG